MKLWTRATCWACKGYGVLLKTHDYWDDEPYSCPYCGGKGWSKTYFVFWTWLAFGICGLVLATMAWHMIFG